MCCLRSLVPITFCSREAKTFYDAGIKPKLAPSVSLRDKRALNPL